MLLPLTLVLLLQTLHGQQLNLYSEEESYEDTYEVNPYEPPGSRSEETVSENLLKLEKHSSTDHKVMMDLMGKMSKSLDKLESRLAVVEREVKRPNDEATNKLSNCS